MKTNGLVNHFYFYWVDADFGPFFLKFCSYFPCNGKLCLNGHEWAQRQASRVGIGHSALDNAFAAADDVAALQSICDTLGPEQIDGLLRKWLAILPHPFSAADRAAGYRYEISILQAEFSLTQMLDKPVSGRIFFEQVIRDNLDRGRPDQISLVFNRRLKRTGPRATPGRFRTRVITEGVRSAPRTATTFATPSRATTASSAKRGLRWTPGACTPRPHRRRGTRRCGRGRTACGIRLFGVTGTRFATTTASFTSRPRSSRSGRSSAVGPRPYALGPDSRGTRQ